MKDVQSELEQRVGAAIVSAFGGEVADADPIIRPAADAKFGDFQANGAMGLAKRLKQKPREVAEAIVEALGDAGGLLEKVEVAGPGFINLTLSGETLSGAVAGLAGDATLGVGAGSGKKVVVDYASPNLAKEMHIGHLRSTIIGDALARVFEAVGDTVVRQNHIGDWGTQFGMLLEHLIGSGWSAESAESSGIADLNALYQEAKKRDDSDAAFAERARQRVVALQSGDAESRALWQGLIGESVRHMNAVFTRLDVKLTDKHLCAESFYNDKLPAVCNDLEAAGIAERSDGALCVFGGGAGAERKEDETPLIVQKSDGGFGYATTDLAAVRYRVGELEADRVVYVVDSRQREHFEKFFDAARRAGWVGESVRLDYVSFGTILGPDRRPFKTREGGTVKLVDVLDEAVRRAGAVIAEKNPDLPPEERDDVAKVVGVGAVKYADLSNDRIKDYVFDYDRMLALEGNTAPYLQYSYTRVASILRKAGMTEADALAGEIAVGEPAERRLGLLLLRYGSVITSVGEALEPHRLCNYLYELAGAFHRFYEACPVLKAGDDTLVASRLALSAFTGRVIREGLGLLGIGVVERM
ncbi:MAG: arginine--tRNA ligase [Planctomycetota bacterium]